MIYLEPDGGSSHQSSGLMLGRRLLRFTWMTGQLMAFFRAYIVKSTEECLESSPYALGSARPPVKYDLRVQAARADYGTGVFGTICQKQEVFNSFA
ncbi:hypothetical protein EVAR_16003_1 [Eumeta japonica]|uniref:Uncharacterized protein n=1 Tax=Eumeta variegata TaxID=151549 RepID=A0A4C1ZIR1_EUMVA|nr:hypothetical protein EVAR_16003_1 [Eumeta japonica]